MCARIAPSPCACIELYSTDFAFRYRSALLSWSPRKRDEQHFVSPMVKHQNWKIQIVQQTAQPVHIACTVIRITSWVFSRDDTTTTKKLFSKQIYFIFFFCCFDGMTKCAVNICGVCKGHRPLVEMLWTARGGSSVQKKHHQLDR